MRLAQRLIFYFLLFLFGVEAKSQVFKDAQTRHRFAQLNFGLDTRVWDSYIQPTDIQSELRLLIGGTHFWGHADFFIGIPLARRMDRGLQPGIETGARYYPWALTDKGIRPYLGLSWQVMHYSFGSGGDMVKNLAMPSIGTTFWYRNFMFDVGAAYSFINEVDYDVYRPKAVSNFGISLGVKYSLETTLSAEKDWESGRTKKVTEILADRKALNGWTVAIGPSVAFHFSPNSHLKRLVRTLFPDRPTEVFLEYGLGYYWHKPDLQLNLSYRSTRASDEDQSDFMSLSKTVITLEGLLFLGDYHGFAPFVGPNVSYDLMQLEVRRNPGTDIIDRNEGLYGGLTFGWDIRPNRIQSWYLRTNLRWMPWRDIYLSNNSPIDFDQFEFNFIQLVLFPDRIF